MEEGEWSATNILPEALQKSCSPAEVSKAARRSVAGGEYGAVSYIGKNVTALPSDEACSQAKQRRPERRIESGLN
jgi:hypothetical protein